MYRKIELMMAKEGLILVGLAIILYAVLFFLQKVPVAMPECRLEFANGETRSIIINPEIRNDSNYRRLLEETYNPPPKLVEKRIKEFIRAGNIHSALISSQCINSSWLQISKAYSYFLGINFVLKLIVIYLVLLFARFIIWAVRTLKKSK